MTWGWGAIPVTITMQGISLRSLLRIMLGELNLTFVVRDEVLKITTPETAENQLETRLYPVADLAQAGRIPVVATQMNSRLQLICDLISAHIMPDSWDNVGGAGSIVSDDAWGFLAISHTDEVHEAIEALLATLRRARAVEAGSPQAQESLVLLMRRSPPRGLALTRPCSARRNSNSNETPLRDVAEFIKSTYGIPCTSIRKRWTTLVWGATRQ